MVGHKRPAAAVEPEGSTDENEQCAPRSSPERRRARRLAQLRRVGVQLLRQLMVAILMGPERADNTPPPSMLRSVGQRLTAYKRAASPLGRVELGRFFLRYLGGPQRERWFRLLARYDQREEARNNGFFENGASSGSHASSQASESS